MRAVVLDTNVVSFLMRGDPLLESYGPYLRGRSLAISFMTVGELYEGAYRARWSQRRLTALRETVKTYVTIPYSIEVCRQWGAIRSERRTRTIAVDDAWIAPAARAHDLPLVTHNPRDFRDIDGLQVVSVPP